MCIDMDSAPADWDPPGRSAPGRGCSSARAGTPARWHRCIRPQSQNSCRPSSLRRWTGCRGCHTGRRAAAGRVCPGGLGQGHRQRGGILSRNFGTHFVTTGDDKKGRFWDGKRDVLWGGWQGRTLPAGRRPDRSPPITGCWENIFWLAMGVAGQLGSTTVRLLAV
jgi:hypothetical protein